RQRGRDASARRDPRRESLQELETQAAGAGAPDVPQQQRQEHDAHQRGGEAERRERRGVHAPPLELRHEARGIALHRWVRCGHSYTSRKRRSTMLLTMFTSSVIVKSVRPTAKIVRYSTVP